MGFWDYLRAVILEEAESWQSQGLPTKDPCILMGRTASPSRRQPILPLGGVIGNRPTDHNIVFGVHWD
jgi:hypothetical protein